jgi:hypothetical protein
MGNRLIGHIQLFRQDLRKHRSSALSELDLAGEARGAAVAPMRR